MKNRQNDDRKYKKRVIKIKQLHFLNTGTQEQEQEQESSSVTAC